MSAAGVKQGAGGAGIALAAGMGNPGDDSAGATRVFRKGSHSHEGGAHGAGKVPQGTPDTPAEHLRYGDCVVLCSPQEKSLVATDGFATQRLHLAPVAPLLERGVAPDRATLNGANSSTGNEGATRYHTGAIDGAERDSGVGDASLQRLYALARDAVVEAASGGLRSVQAGAAVTASAAPGSTIGEETHLADVPYRVGAVRDFGDCVFQVLPARQYAAAAAYLRGLEREATDLIRLRKAAQEEDNLNEALAVNMRGRVVRYDSAVQLRHVRSGRFLTGRPRQVSHISKERTMAELDLWGDEHSHIVLLPRYKHRRAGDPVSLQDRVLFFVASLHMYVSHTALAPAASQTVEEYDASAEVNLRNDQRDSDWSVFRCGSGQGIAGDPARKGASAAGEASGAPSSAADESSVAGDAERTITSRRKKGKACIRGGDVVRLFHPERGSFLVSNTPAAAPGDRDAEMVELQRNSDDGHHPDRVGDAAAIVSAESTALGLWIVEPANVASRWDLHWGERCRLRHLCSGRYLSATSHIQPGRPSVLVASLYPRGLDSLFEFHPAVGTATQAPLPHGRLGMCLRHAGTGCWVSANTSAMATAIAAAAVQPVTTAESPRRARTGLSPARPEPAGGGGGGVAAASPGIPGASGRLARSLSGGFDQAGSGMKDGTHEHAAPARSKRYYRMAYKKRKKELRDKRTMEATARLRAENARAFWAARERAMESDEAAVKAVIDEKLAAADMSAWKASRSLRGKRAARSHTGSRPVSAPATRGRSEAAAASRRGGSPSRGRREQSQATLSGTHVRELQHLTPSDARGGQMLDLGAAAEGNGDVLDHTICLFLSAAKREDDSFRLVSEGRNWVTQVSEATSLLLPLRTYSDLVFHRSILQPHDETAITRVLADLILFCTTPSADSPWRSQASVRPLDIRGTPVSNKQSLLCELHAVDWIIEMIQSPFSEWGGPFAMGEMETAHEAYGSVTRHLRQMSTMVMIGSSLRKAARGAKARVQAKKGASKSSTAGGGAAKPAGGESVDSLGDDGSALVALTAASRKQVLVIQRTSRVAYKLLRHVFTGSRSAEFVVSRHLHVMTKQVGYALDAETALTQLFQANRHVLDSLDTSDVAAFLDLIRQKGRRAELLAFLTSICSCMGAGVPSKQELVCDLIFGDGDGVLNKSEGDGKDDEEEGGNAGIDTIVPVRSTTHEYPEIQLLTDPILPYVDFLRENGYSDDQHARRAWRRDVQRTMSEETGWLALIDLFSAGTRLSQGAATEQLRDFVVAQIELFVAMCLDRNYTCIRVLRLKFSRPALFAAAASKKLPSKVRSQLVRLLTVLYVDVKPQEEVRIVPTKAPRLWDRLSEPVEIPGAPEVDPAVLGTTAIKADRRFFGELKDEAIEYLEDTGGRMLSVEEDQNALTLSVLQLAARMLQFGMFNEERDIERLARPVIMLLDGRSDDPGVAHVTASKLRVTPVRVVEGGGLRRHHTQRMTIAEIRAGASGARDHKRSSHVPIAFGTASSASAATGISHLGERALPRVLSDLRELVKNPLSPTGESEAGKGSAQEDAEGSSVLVRCKVVMCKILGHMIDIRENVQLSGMMRVFHDNHMLFVHSQGGADPATVDSGSPTAVARTPGAEYSRGATPDSLNDGTKRNANFTSSQAKTVVNNIRQIVSSRFLRLEDMTETSLVAALADLLMYRSGELVAAALEVLSRLFRRTQAAMKALTEVQLVTSVDGAQVMNRLTAAVRQLGQAAESSEEWMACETYEDQLELRRVWFLLDILSDMMLRGWQGAVGIAEPHQLAPYIMANRDSVESAEATVVEWVAKYGRPTLQPASDLDTIDPERQLLMLNYGAVESVLSLLEETIDGYKARVAADPTVQSQLYSEVSQLWLRCHRFLITFARKNSHGSLLNRKLDQFLSWVNEGLGDVLIFEAIFRDNLQLCRDLSVGVIRGIVNGLHDRGADYRYLAPLHASLVCQGRILEANQLRVVRELLSHGDSLLLLYFDTHVGRRDILQAATPETMDRLRPHLLFSEEFGSPWFRQVMDSDATVGNRVPGRVVYTDISDTARIQTELHEFLFDERGSSSLVSPAQILYCMRLMSLLAECTAGRSYLVEAAVQGMLSFEQLTTALACQAMPLELRVCLQELLFDAWLDVERIPGDVITHEPFVHVMMTECRRLLKVKPLLAMMHSVPDVMGASSPEEERHAWRMKRVIPLKYVFGGLIPSVELYVGRLADVSTRASAAASETQASGGFSLGPSHLANACVEALVEWLAKPQPPFSSTVIPLLSDGELVAMTRLASVVLASKACSSCHAAARQLEHVVTSEIHDRKVAQELNVEARERSDPSRTRGNRRSGIVQLDAHTRLRSFDCFVKAMRSNSSITEDQAHEFAQLVDLFADIRSRVKSDVLAIAGIELTDDGSVLGDDLDSAAGAHPRGRGVRRISVEELADDRSLGTDFSDWSFSDISFDDVVRRVIDLAHDATTAQGTIVTLVLEILQEIIRRAAESGSSEMLSRVQERLSEHLVTATVYDQVCRPWENEPDGHVVFQQLMRTGIALLDEGNEAVQLTFRDLFKFPGSTSVRTFVGKILKRLSDATDDYKGMESTRTLASSMRHGGGKVDEASLLGADDEQVFRSTLYDELTDIFRFLQLLCEGHFLEIQEFLGTPIQSGGTSIVAQSVMVLAALHDRISSQASELVVQVFDTLIEYIQGPCTQNQMVLVTNHFVEVTCHVLHSTLVGPLRKLLPAEQSKTLRYKCVLSLLSLFEGHSDARIYDRVATQLQVPTMKRLMTRVYRDLHVLHGGQYVDSAFFWPFETEDPLFDDVGTKRSIFEEAVVPVDKCAVLETGFSVFILLRLLMSRNPKIAALVLPSSEDNADSEPDASSDSDSDATVPRVDAATASTEDRGGQLKRRLTMVASTMARKVARVKVNKRVSYPEAYAFFREHTARIEIVRDGALEHLYFPIPPMCDFVTEATKQAYKWDLDRESAGKKLGDFFSRHVETLREMRHQQRLRRMYNRIPLVAFVAARVETLKSVSFVLAILINVLVLMCYQATSLNRTIADVVCDNKLLDRDLGGFNVKLLISFLGTMQASSATLIVIFFYLVRARSPTICCVAQTDAVLPIFPLVRMRGLSSGAGDSKSGPGRNSSRPLEDKNKAEPSHTILQWTQR